MSVKLNIKKKRRKLEKNVDSGSLIGISVLSLKGSAYFTD